MAFLVCAVLVLCCAVPMLELQGPNGSTVIARLFRVVWYSGIVVNAMAASWTGSTETTSREDSEREKQNHLDWQTAFTARIVSRLHLQLARMSIQQAPRLYWECAAM